MSKDSLRALADGVQGEKCRNGGLVRKRKVWRTPGRRKHTQLLNDGEMIVFLCSFRWHVKIDCDMERHILKQSLARVGALVMHYSLSDSWYQWT